MKVGIIGAGFAGVAAAQVIAEAGIEVKLFSKEKVLPYYRPRLPQFAFGQDEEDNIFVHNAEWYDKNNIELLLDTEVKAFNKDLEILLKNGEKEKFDAIIVSTGGMPIVPDFAKKFLGNNVLTIWDYSDAEEINRRIKSTKRMVIIGGGILGIECALRAQKDDLSVSVIEKMPHLMTRNFGEKASKVIEAQLQEKNVDIMLEKDVKVIENTYNNKTIVNIGGKGGVLCDYALLSIGASFDVSMAKEAGINTDRQIIVDNKLQTSITGIYAAGDIAQLSSPGPCSARESSLQGKIAGANVVAYLKDEEQQIYEAEPVPLRFKYRDFELYSIGKTPNIGSREEILDYKNMELYRACVYEHCALAGVQMVGSNKDFIKLQKEFLASKIWRGK